VAKAHDVRTSRLFHWRSRGISNAFGPTIAQSAAISTSGTASVGAGTSSPAAGTNMRPSIAIAMPIVVARKKTHPATASRNIDS
jgi:hypothetical protein